METTPVKKYRGKGSKPEHLKRRQIGISLPGWLIQYLDISSKPRVTQIENACIIAYGWLKPNDTGDNSNKVKNYLRPNSEDIRDIRDIRLQNKRLESIASLLEKNQEIIADPDMRVIIVKKIRDAKHQMLKAN